MKIEFDTENMDERLQVKSVLEALEGKWEHSCTEFYEWIRHELKYAQPGDTALCHETLEHVRSKFFEFLSDRKLDLYE